MSPLELQQLGEAIAFCMKVCVVSSFVFAFVGWLAFEMVMNFIRPRLRLQQMKFDRLVRKGWRFRKGVFGPPEGPA